MTQATQSNADARAIPTAELIAMQAVWNKTGWTWAELMDFVALKLALARSGIDTTMKFGITEAGMPWAALAFETRPLASAFILCTDDGYMARWYGLPDGFAVERLSDVLTRLTADVVRGRCMQ